ncbi:MAG: hypothetical protein H6658_02910 [Ardenticatenaceae bacterium]|nr:hypothetical protein [Ardenticatenaceae bacterium]
MEDVLSAALSASLPDLSNVPVDVQGDLARMVTLDDASLWDMSRQMLPEKTEERWQQLREIQDERELNAKETAELDNLRREYGRITLQKARALALLSSRNGRPLLQDLA